MKYREEKRSEFIKEIIAEYIGKEGNGTSMITVTRFEIGGKGEVATFYISAMPESQEQAALDFVRRNLGEIRASVMKSIPSGRIPFLSVELDKAEKLRRKIDSL